MSRYISSTLPLRIEVAGSDREDAFTSASTAEAVSLQVEPASVDQGPQAAEPSGVPWPWILLIAVFSALVIGWALAAKKDRRWWQAKCNVGCNCEGGENPDLPDCPHPADGCGERGCGPKGGHTHCPKCGGAPCVGRCDRKNGHAGLHHCEHGHDF